MEASKVAKGLSSKSGNEIANDPHRKKIPDNLANLKW